MRISLHVDRRRNKMSMISSIASASISLKSSELMTNVGVALMGKTMDIAEEQGQAIQEMLDASGAVTSGGHVLDVYA